MSTPGKPRQSGIPAPGRISGIPTPGRSRSSSSAGQNAPIPPDVEYMSRAFADAIKANDPAMHRTTPPSSSPHSTTFASQLAPHPTTAPRPSSVASSSSAVNTTQARPTFERAKTPTTTRPPSRHSDVFGRSVSRAGRAFDIGDNVRIESLGYEGTLRYIGAIEGKLGLWAGVELSGGFAGKGKNNGAVNGTRYFSCSPNCGVFVATTKLSPPTVGPGAVPRPSSVASSRGGRTTPSISGRITPAASSSFSSGRITPSAGGRTTPSLSSGRVTPGTTPAARARLKTVTKSANGPPASGASLADKLTAGSRASKYASMTAKQLDSRGSDQKNPSHMTDPSSPVRSITSAYPSNDLSSPSRSQGSPFNTPKPGLGSRISTSSFGISTNSPVKGRPSLSTPRARIPSAVAMPPPPSPASSSRSISLNEKASEPDERLGSSSLSDLELNGKALQDKIASLMSGSVPAVARSSPRPDSATSIRSTNAEEKAYMDRLHSRLDALEYDNDRLRAALDAAPAAPDQNLIIETLQQERDEALTQICQLKNDLAVTETSLQARDLELESLASAQRQSLLDSETSRKENDSRFEALESKQRASDAFIHTLEENLAEKVDRELQNESILTAKNTEIAALEAQVENLRVDLESERRELGAQIDELRQAGQETIALYEERLSAADSQRYELENKIISLELGARPSVRAPSPNSELTSAAAQIDNESLRDQVRYLQKKITTMEDTLEDARAASERDEANVGERMKRLRDKEEAMRKELDEGRKEVERMLSSEVNARNRVDEIEEALRESTLALENARAEVEGLRAEIADLDGLVADVTTGDLSSRVAEIAQRASTDRSAFTEQIAGLKQALEESRLKEHEANERLAERGLDSDFNDRSGSLVALRELEIRTSELEQEIRDLNSQLDDEHRVALDLRSELDSLRKKTNRDLPVNHNALSSGPQSPSSSKYDLSTARDEITGLKHIVQDLQQQNLVLDQKNKQLESENQLLASETDQLRQEVRVLEDNLDQSFTKEEQYEPTSFASDDIQSLQRLMKEQKMEIEQLRKRLSDAEMKNTRTIHDLNKEISELEALVESKIYREDELEQELERMKDKLSRHKKSSKSSSDSIEIRNRASSTSGDSTSTSSEPRPPVCEICESSDHDIFNCDLLKDDVTISRPLAQVHRPNSSSDLFCVDCESHGHTAVDCPHSLDVF